MSGGDELGGLRAAIAPTLVFPTKLWRHFVDGLVESAWTHVEIRWTATARLQPFPDGVRPADEVGVELLSLADGRRSEARGGATSGAVSA